MSRDVKGVPTVPSNVPILSKGTATIKLYRDLLWKDNPRPVNVDGTASALKFMEALQQELTSRYPEYAFRFLTFPGDAPVLVDFSDGFVDGAKITTEVLRLGLLVLDDPSRWHVIQGSREAKAIARRFAGRRLDTPESGLPS